MNYIGYDHHAQRRCVACGPVGGQYPLRAIVKVGTHMHVVDDQGRLVQCAISDAVQLECGHLDDSHAEFVAANTRSDDW